MHRSLFGADGYIDVAVRLDREGVNPSVVRFDGGLESDISLPVEYVLVAVAVSDPDVGDRCLLELDFDINLLFRVNVEIRRRTASDGVGVDSLAIIQAVDKVCTTCQSADAGDGHCCNDLAADHESLFPFKIKQCFGQMEVAN